MWIASKIGFFSIVRKDGFFHVRGRVRADLENLRRAANLGSQIETWPEADYRWRLRLGILELGLVFAALEETIDYPNFKSEIHATPGQRKKLNAYSDLWSGLARLQRYEAVGLQDDFHPPCRAQGKFPNLCEHALLGPKTSQTVRLPEKAS